MFQHLKTLEAFRSTLVMEPCEQKTDFNVYVVYN